MNIPPTAWAITLAALAGLALYALYAAPMASVAPLDSCKLSETEIRKLWVSAAIHARHGPDGRRDEADRLNITQQLIQQAENLCRHERDARPTPLPAELQRHLR